MSKVSPNNDTLPSFEPIERKPSTKRRRIPSKDTNPADLPSKRPKGKENEAKKITPPVPESIIWIGAKIIEQNNMEEEGNKSDRTAAFSVYYGTDDSRNLVQRLSMKGTDDLEYVYIKGVLHAIETCTDDFSKLSIHTGSKTIESVLTSTEDVPEYSELYSQIKEKISTRKGATVISYTQGEKKEKEDKEATSYKAAHCLAKEFLEVVPDEDKEMTPVEDVVVECLDITSKNQIDEGVSVEDKKEKIKEEVVVEEKTVVKETIIVETTETATATPAATPAEEKRASWLGIRNIINIFKSPFNTSRQ